MKDRRLTMSQRLVGVAEEVYRRVFWVISSLGLPPSFVIRLEVAGRRSGRVRSTVLVTADREGERYLVSVLGEDSDWVRNLRVAGGNAFIRHGRRRAFRLEEVPPEQRAPILKAYLKWALGARAVFQLGPGAPLEEFARIADRHPVFRIIEAEG